MSSSSSSTNNSIRCSNDMRYNAPIRSNTAQNDRKFKEHPSAVQAANLTNRLKGLKINDEVRTTSTQTTTLDGSPRSMPLENETLAEEKLIERFQQIIHEFMTRPGRNYTYNTTIEWCIDHAKHLNYNVKILITHPSDSS